jgi:hypothetical protein
MERNKKNKDGFNEIVKDYLKSGVRNKGAALELIEKGISPDEVAEWIKHGVFSYEIEKFKEIGVSYVVAGELKKIQEEVVTGRRYIDFWDFCRRLLRFIKRRNRNVKDRYLVKIIKKLQKFDSVKLNKLYDLLDKHYRDMTIEELIVYVELE